MPIVLDNNKIGAIGEYIKENTEGGATISISSPIFTIYAFEELRKVLENSGKFRFLFNEPTFVRDIIHDNKEVKEFELKMAQRERSVSEFNLEIGLKNNLDQNQVASKCHDFIAEKGEIRSITKEGIASASNVFVENNDNSFLVSGNNLSFSKSGLGYTTEVRFDFNQVATEDEVVEQYKLFFEQLFNNEDIVVDVKEELLKHLGNLYRENSPELLYYLTLYNIFGEKLVNMDDLARVKEKTGITDTKIWNALYNFQHDAVVGAIKKLELYNGCIIADSVGLGKTFEALAIIKYYELRNDRVLVLCPKKLRNNWTGFKQNSTTNAFTEDRFNYDVLNHTDLSREKGQSGEIKLETLNWGNYDLVVIDESHNFRNNEAIKGHKTRYQRLMENIIKSGVKTKVLMLSATPVNNTLSDLKNQVMFITEGCDDAFEDSSGISSISNTLKKAQRAFNQWAKFDQEEQTTETLLPLLDYDFFNLLNTVTIARSRKHIKTYYDTKDIGEFPARKDPKSIKADIDADSEFPELSYINNKIAGLHLAAYSPMIYIMPNRREKYEKMYDQKVQEGRSVFKQVDRELAIVNLMRVNILKRMESSVNSFALTLERVLGRIDEMYRILDSNEEFEDAFSEEAEDLDDDSNAVGGKIKVKAADIDKIRMMEDLDEDREVLNELLSYAAKVDSKRDLKLQKLKDEITNKIKNPINGTNKKVIVFTTFSDTAEYLYDSVSGWLLKEHGLYSALVTGGSVRNNHKGIRKDFDSILAHFSPKSNNFDTKGEDIDLLIATDCISEGQNLQDCDYLINYDIHWNPVRIVQRFGRIDRIGSSNKRIQLVNFWPNMELDEYIKLESRVRSKMAMVNVTGTGDENIINPEQREFNYRAKQLKQLQSEVLDVEEMQGGISITDLTLDDFMMSLDRYMKENPKVLEKYPTGVYAVTNKEERLGADAVKGVIYCLKQTKHSESQEGATSLYPYYLVYVSDNGDIHITNSSPKKILDIYKALCQNKTEPIEHLVKDFNKETKNGSVMTKYTDLLEKAVFDIKGVADKKGVQSMFQIGAATLFENTVSGLNDFELISFLVVM